MNCANAAGQALLEQVCAAGPPPTIIHEAASILIDQALIFAGQTYLYVLVIVVITAVVFGRSRPQP